MAARVPEIGRFSGSTKPKDKVVSHHTKQWVKAGPSGQTAAMHGKPLEQPSLLRPRGDSPKKL